MANKRYDQFTAGTPTGSRIFLHANAGDGSLEKATLQELIDEVPNAYNIFSVIRALGSPIIASSLDLSPLWYGTGVALTSSWLWFQLIAIPAGTITGVWWLQQTKGTYTASNYNGIALYSISGTTLTLIGSSTNDGAIWTAASNTFNKKAFTATVSVTTGPYYVALIYSASSASAVPFIGVPTSFSTWPRGLGMSGGFVTQALQTGTTALPSTISISSINTGGTAPLIFGVY